LLKSISEDEFKKQLQIREKKQNKHIAIRQVLDTFITVGIENILNINDAKYNTSEKTAMNTVKQSITQLQEIRKYTNECLANVSKKFSCKVPIVELDWAKVVTNRF
jgi:flagellar biosynthesis chaperone FliJ